MRVSRWTPSAHPPALAPDAVHVWRIPLDRPHEAAALRPLLSAEERARADRFFAEAHRVRFAVAHGWLRVLLGRYVGLAAESLAFACGPHGKPSLVGTAGAAIEFNLSHSADLALVAVGRRALGVDVERRDRAVEHLELAERFFSPDERDALRALAADDAAVVDGFFATWTRKEAYLKATGHGITRGLHHFDVTFAPGAPARILADRLDPDAARRWAIASFEAAPDYSAALVAAAPLREVALLEPTGPAWGT